MTVRVWFTWESAPCNTRGAYGGPERRKAPKAHEVVMDMLSVHNAMFCDSNLNGVNQSATEIRKMCQGIDVMASTRDSQIVFLFSLNIVSRKFPARCYSNSQKIVVRRTPTLNSPGHRFLSLETIDMILPTPPESDRSVFFNTC